jgi:hypothetical protein
MAEYDKVFSLCRRNIKVLLHQPSVSAGHIVPHVSLWDMMNTPWTLHVSIPPGSEMAKLAVGFL